MKNLLIMAGCLSLLGCSGCATDGVKFEKVNEVSAHKAAEWVKLRSGFIRNAVSAITHVAVYSTEEDTHDRTKTLEILNAIAGNLNALVSQGEVNPEAISQALSINEPYFGPLFASVAMVIQSEMNHFKENGYGHLMIEVIEAASAGIKDGSVTK